MNRHPIFLRAFHSSLCGGIMETTFAGRKAVSKSATHGVVSDAESTVSSSSSNDSAKSSLKWKREQRRYNGQRCKSDIMPNKGDSEEDAGDTSPAKSLVDTLGTIVETTEVQMAIILLIALDMVATAVEMHLHDQHQLAVALQQLDSNGKGVVVVEPLLTRIVTRLVESFTGFTIFLFLIEIAVLLAAFQHKFFSHAGYVLDLVVVGLSLLVELYAQSKTVRLFGTLRVWRVLRLIRRLVDQERSAHDATSLLLEQEQLRSLHVQMEKDAANESLKREYDSLEKLLLSYKDEIVTLKEALQIAAEAVAATDEEAAPDQGISASFTNEAAASEGPYGSLAPMQEGGFAEYYRSDEAEPFMYGQEVAEVHPTSNFSAELEKKNRQDSENEESDFEDAVEC